MGFLYILCMNVNANNLFLRETMSATKISNILNKLLSEQHLRVSELARQVKLPQPTIQRIAAGTCENPHMTSLEPIAQFFKISIDQLKGLEPIPRFDRIRKLPLVSWSNVLQYTQKQQADVDDYILADIKTSEKAYALKVADSAMDPLFPLDTILIVDPTVIAKDRSYIIAQINKTNIPIFRQLIINGEDKILKPLSLDSEIYKMTYLTKYDTILATIVQARRNYVD